MVWLMMLHLHMNIGIKSKAYSVEYNEYRISESQKRGILLFPEKEKMRIKEIIETMGVCF